jgi:FkbM family methyltransferase
MLFKEILAKLDMKFTHFPITIAQKLIGGKLHRQLVKGRNWNKVRRSVARELTDVVCIDLGASYFPHTRWLTFLEAPGIEWVAVDPMGQNLSYEQSWPWQCKLQTLATAVSGSGGERILYRTNIDSGSSLLRPHPKDYFSDSYRLDEGSRNYMFPITEVPVSTATLNDIVGMHSSRYVMLKMDTQGSELEILQGSSDLLDDHRVLLIEIETSLLVERRYEGAPSFWEVSRWLVENDFEILRVFPGRPDARKIDSEADIVFALRRELVLEEELSARAALYAAYLSYGLSFEADDLLRVDGELRLALGL